MTRVDLTRPDGWLRRLEWALEPLTAPERADIVREARSHIEERARQGLDEPGILRAMGPPEDYAREFLDGYELSRALGAATLPGMMAAAAHRMHRSAMAAGAFVSVVLLALLAAGALLTAAMHFLDPQHWGLWISSRMLLLGQVDEPGEATEILGAGIYPFASLIVAICWVAGRQILRAALKAVARQSSGES